ncbi:MAG TPA: phosphosulfolactate synthase [Candidatus Dormibacteraeota bacterium]|jgi:phosphosulfolactate synthase|nr:phosphosulfolactate synthase [Candidatus Dormibacteraeota bacterium]
MTQATRHLDGVRNGSWAAPRHVGLTMMIDPGLPTGAFIDVVDSHGALIDMVKFGWGTALVTRDLHRKIAVLREANIEFFFGGTLFERYLWDNRLPEFVGLLRRSGATHVEVSNGTVPLDQEMKAACVRRLATEFVVLSEVGFKDVQRSDQLTPAQWVEAIAMDLDAGASLVITETRESGRSGMADRNGRLRADVLEAVLASIDPTRLVFEAPTKDLQVELIHAVGPAVNLGNIAAADVVGVETLRLGLRADTLLHRSPHLATATPVQVPAQAVVTAA